MLQLVIEFCHSSSEQRNLENLARCCSGDFFVQSTANSVVHMKYFALTLLETKYTLRLFGLYNQILGSKIFQRLNLGSLPLKAGMMGRCSFVGGWW